MAPSVVLSQPRSRRLRSSAVRSALRARMVMMSVGLLCAKAPWHMAFSCNRRRRATHSDCSMNRRRPRVRLKKAFFSYEL